jgi:hypothetical protein
VFEEYRIRAACTGSTLGFWPVGSGIDVKAHEFQTHREQLEDIRILIDHQDTAALARQPQSRTFRSSRTHHDSPRLVGAQANATARAIMRKQRCVQAEKSAASRAARRRTEQADGPRVDVGSLDRR